MFKRKSQEKNKPEQSLMLQVEAYVASEGSKDIDTVVGRDLNGKPYSVILTTSGDAAENTKRNDLLSFSKEKSNHYVPVGGMILFSTVWVREPEAEGEPTTGIARWAEFFGHSRNELSIGNAMYRAGTNVEGTKETNWGALDRLGKPLSLTPEQFPGAVAALADKCASDRSRARPIVRLMSEDGKVIDFTSIRQGVAEVEVDGEKVKRAENGAQVVEGLKKNPRLTKMLEIAAAGQGTIEMIPVMSIEMSKKMMNSPRGANYVALAKRFQDDKQVYAAECYIRRAPSDEFNYISHLSVTPKDRFDPLLVPSEKFPAPAYSDELLKEAGIDPAKPADKAADPQPQSEPEPDQFDNPPGFDS
ncbi:hypothetical protein [Pseudomonas sp. GXZC]|uniref:hypothetical protein n=1 Tax=Pseudomonas sp. GXZC TaxID=3003351 RepID=UPI0022AB4BD7|nr:hypothetical protein [Pseudomonas sp. GXZC]WAT32099.1 hypothetical protein OZ428_34120 [Pseudomonas sp. GXZC]